jgi:hypothetical protein
VRDSINICFDTSSSKVHDLDTNMRENNEISGAKNYMTNDETSRWLLSGIYTSGNMRNGDINKVVRYAKSGKPLIDFVTLRQNVASIVQFAHI